MFCVEKGPNQKSLFWGLVWWELSQKQGKIVDEAKGEREPQIWCFYLTLLIAPSFSAKTASVCAWGVTFSSVSGQVVLVCLPGVCMWPKNVHVNQTWPFGVFLSSDTAEWMEQRAKGRLNPVLETNPMTPNSECFPLLLGKRSWFLFAELLSWLTERKPTQEWSQCREMKRRAVKSGWHSLSP